MGVTPEEALKKVQQITSFASVLNVAPIYLLPRAELDKIPGGYEDGATVDLGVRISIAQSHLIRKQNAKEDLDQRREKDIRHLQHGGSSDKYYSRYPDLPRAQIELGDTTFLERNDHKGRVQIAERVLAASPLCADAWCDFIVSHRSVLSNQVHLG